MTTYNTANSSSTFTAASDADAVEVTVRGGAGGDGADSSSGNTGGSGGAAGFASGLLSGNAGEDFDVFVGEAGGNGGGGSGGSGGSSPFDGGVSGGSGGDNGLDPGAGGGGGAPSAVKRVSDGAVIAVGEGGGGGGGAGDTSNDGSGGGGGARGGLGGAGNVTGSDATGSGSGGDGGDGGAATNAGNPGGDGGTATAGALSDVSTGTTTSGPEVVILSRYDPNAPTSLSADDVRATEIDISWSDDDSSPAGDNEDGYRVYTSTDGGTTQTQVASLGPNTTSHTLTGLRTGEQYYIRVEAYNDVGTASDSIAGITTTLPDADQPTLGNGVEDEIAVDRQTQPTTYGDVRWQVRETGETSWSASAVGFDEGTVAFDTLTFNITGREDGEEYDVRLRTETEHVTGAWTTGVSIVTKFPAATGLAAANVTTTSLDLSWSDNSDNEDSFRVQRRREYPAGFGAWSTVASLAPNTTTYTDGAVLPDTTYEYRIEGVTDDTTATSGTIQVQTSSLGVRDRPIPCSGWYVEVDHPDGTTVTPSPRDGAEMRPSLNDRPEVAIPVERADHWARADRWERQPMRVWLDGSRLPIGYLAEVRETEGGVELIGRGGQDLRSQLEKRYDDTNAHDAIRDILGSTSLAVTVDAAPTTTNALLQTLQTTADWESAVTDDTVSAVDLSNDTAAPAQTGYITAPNDIKSGSTTTNSSQNWTSSTAVELSMANQESASWTVDLDYEIPDSRIGLYLRIAFENVEGYAVAKIDGTTVGYDIFSSGSTNLSAQWGDFFTPIQGGASNPGDLSSGSHTLTLETTASDPDGAQNFGPAGTFYIDAAVLYDTDYWTGSNFVNSLNGANLLDGGPPGQYTATDIDVNADPILRATGGRLEASLSSTANSQAIGLSQDGASYTTNANTDTIETDFASDTSAFIARLTLGGVDGSTSDNTDNVTTHRTLAQSASELTIKYDSLDSAGVDRTLNDTIIALLSDLADRANLIWEIQWDPSVGSQRVVVTRVGQRTSDADPDIATYDITKRNDDELRRADVYGRTQAVEGESFDADPGGVDLTHDHIQEDSERVYDPATGTVYERGPDKDYTMNYLLGIINDAGSAASDISNGQSLAIDYTWRPTAGYGRTTTAQNDVVTSINSLTTEADCRQAARFIVEDLDAPQFAATVTIPRREAGFNLVDAIDPSRLPTPAGGSYEIESVQTSPREVQLRLGSGPSVSEIVRRIEASLSETAREV